MRKISPKSNNLNPSEVSIWQEAITDFEFAKIQKLNAIQQVLAYVRVYDKFLFYPLIGKLLSDIGFRVSITRDGDTNNRADAIIIDEKYSIPIEIKSPTEIEYINVKSVQQAMENKIILLSREFHKTTPETSTLSIGYYYPEERSDIAELVNNIYETYKIRIGYIDFSDLLSIHWDTIFLNHKFDHNTFRNLKGAYNETITAKKK